MTVKLENVTLPVYGGADGCISPHFGRCDGNLLPAQESGRNVRIETLFCLHTSCVTIISRQTFADGRELDTQSMQSPHLYQLIAVSCLPD